MYEKFNKKQILFLIYTKIKCLFYKQKNVIYVLHLLSEYIK